MNAFPYIVAIALIEVNGRRAMPLGGKSLKRSISEHSSPGREGELISLELLMRVFQRSEEGPISKAEKENSFLLIEIPLEVMQNQIPLLKSEWLNSGDTKVLLNKLEEITSNIWTLEFIRYEGMKFNKLSSKRN